MKTTVEMTKKTLAAKTLAEGKSIHNAARAAMVPDAVIDGWLKDDANFNEAYTLGMRMRLCKQGAMKADAEGNDEAAMRLIDLGDKARDAAQRAYLKVRDIENGTEEAEG